MAAWLEVDDVSWRAGARTIVSGVSFRVAVGEFVALMGRNGAGKSTVLDVIAGLRAPASGEIRLEGRALDAWSPRDRARVVAHLPQAVRTDLPFVVEDLVLMGRYPHTDRWFESDADRAAVEQAMRRTGCWELRQRLVRTLSGGERQRVLLAACLAQEPKLWLLDEPSTFLDVDQQVQCFAELRAECERGVTCVAVTHDVNLALTYATRIIVLAGGRVVADVPAAEAATSPAWLQHLSTRLELQGTAGGRPWVSYV
jgi:iron complex transport system ATP-binding protein